MATQARIIAGSRDRNFDRYIQDLVDADGYGVQREYYGIENADRAEVVRRKLRTAGTHLGHSVKAFWGECAGCDNGGPSCRYHVYFTAYDTEAARAYKQKQAAARR
jgi:hypothetical protein